MSCSTARFHFRVPVVISAIGLVLNRSVLSLLAQLPSPARWVSPSAEEQLEAGAVADCANPDQWAETTHSYEPFSGAGRPLTVRMDDTGQGAQTWPNPGGIPRRGSPNFFPRTD
jgi:hypothetical protein